MRVDDKEKAAGRFGLAGPVAGDNVAHRFVTRDFGACGGLVDKKHLYSISGPLVSR